MEVNTIFVCRERLSFLPMIFSLMSQNTKNPIPPTIIKDIITRFTTTSPLQPMRLSEKIEKPALQKADIEWKIEAKREYRGENLEENLG